VVCLAACSSSIVSPSTGDRVDAGPLPFTEPPAPSGTRLDGGRPPGPKVEETGSECEANADCEGRLAICVTQLDLSRLGNLAEGVGGGGLSAGQNIPPVLFPGGYCSALCGSNDDCSPGAACGVQELLDLTNDLLGVGATGGVDLPVDAIPALCLDRCLRTTDCREGYVCDSLVGAATSLAQGAGAVVAPDGLGLLLALLPRYCLPKAPQPVFDAGPGLDASTVRVDAGPRSEAGVDATVTDASIEDARVEDAAVDDASAGAVQPVDGSTGTTDSSVL